ncbi:DUF6807 family protein [Streptomyces hypolithicus]
MPGLDGDGECHDGAEDGDRQWCREPGGGGRHREAADDQERSRRRVLVEAPSTLVFAEAQHAPWRNSQPNAQRNAQWDDGTMHPSSHWFVRSEPTPTVAVSWAFHEEFALPPGDSFSCHYRVVVADGEPEYDRIESFLSRSRHLTEYQ